MVDGHIMPDNVTAYPNFNIWYVNKYGGWSNYARYYGAVKDQFGSLT